MNAKSVKRILILAANPSGSTPLRLDQEVREIDEGLRRAKKRDCFELTQRWALRPKDLHRAMLDVSPHIVHFSGHGTGNNGLVLEGESGRPKLVSAEALAGLFELFSQQLQCVLLNACYSQVQAEAISQHIQYVIGIDDVLNDRAAIDFSTGFYDALGAGKSIEFAYKLGCSNLQLSGFSGHSVPILRQKKSNDKGCRIGLPNMSTFYGRHQELKKLEQWANREQANLIAVLGIGGIGKTALVTRLAELVGDDFQHTIWLSVREAQTVEETLRVLLKYLSHGENFDSQITFDEKVSEIIGYLGSLRCLIVLDNVESILEKGSYTGKYRQGYEGYGVFFRRIGESSHKSCLLITSREKPHEISELESDRASIHSLDLTGLMQAEAEKILDSKGITGSTSEFKQLNDLYNGNPLALKLIPETINYIFNGSIQEFLTANTSIFEDRINTLLEEQIDRTSDFEKAILYWLAINRESVSYSDLKDDICFVIGGKEKEIISSLNSLQRRSLIESNESFFTLQNVVMEYVTDRLVSEMCKGVKNREIYFFNRYSLLKATVKDYVRETQRRLILVPVSKELISSFESVANTEECLKHIILALRESASNSDNMRLSPGYAAGNIINLLCQMNIDLTGYDLSRLFISQASLGGVNCTQVNFSRSHFSRCTFSETIASVFSTTFHPNGKLFALGDASGDIHFLDVKNRQKLITCKGHSHAVWALAFSPKGHILVSSSDDRDIRLWEVETGQCLMALKGHENWVRAIKFHPSGKYLVSGSYDATVKVWNAGTGECLKTFEGHRHWIRTVSFNRDGTILATGGGDGTVRLWDFESGECLSIIEEEGTSVMSIAFNADSSILAVAGSDHIIKLWDIQQIKLITQVATLEGHTNEIHAVTFSPNGRLLASGGQDKVIRLWNIEDILGDAFSSSFHPRKLNGHTSWIWSIDFDENGQTLVSGSADQSVRLWDPDSMEGRCIEIWQGRTFWIRSVIFHGSERNLISGGSDHAIRLWNVPNTKKNTILEGHTDQVCSVSSHVDGQTLASSSWDGTIKIWNMCTSECVATLKDHTSTPWSISFSPDGKVLASGSNDSTVKIWDTEGYKCIETLAEHEAQVYSVDFSPDGKVLASGSFDSTVKLWDKKSYNCIQTLYGKKGEMYTTVTFSHDSKILAAGNRSNTIQLWDLDSYDNFQSLTGHEGWLYSLAFSPREKLIASGSDDQTVRIWKVGNDECIKVFKGHTGTVYSVAFSPDGAVVASSSDDETIRLWDVKAEKCLAILKSPLPYEGMNLSKATGLTEAQKNTMIALGAHT
ncbi:MAG: NB-ARC domain-containing protein [Cyanobacteria bacterium J06650_10]